MGVWKSNSNVYFFLRLCLFNSMDCLAFKMSCVRLLQGTVEQEHTAKGNGGTHWNPDLKNRAACK